VQLRQAFLLGRRGHTLLICEWRWHYMLSSCFLMPEIAHIIISGDMLQ
jgi:uncharacterized membrane protein YhhN